MPHTNTTRRGRGLAAATALTLATALVATVAPAPAQAGIGSPQETTAQWLGEQLTAGLVHNDQYGFDDYGLTLDVGLGLRGLGLGNSTVSAIDAAIQPNVEAYTTGIAWGSDDVYAGATAKALTFAAQVGADPTSYGGVNLVRQLNKRVIKHAPSKGRIKDKGATDYANVVGQVFAVQGLAAASSGQRRNTLRFLLKQQCDQGYFRLDFTPRKKRKNQSCDGGNPTTISAPDTDTTALAVIGLVALGSDQPSVRQAITTAKRWLKRQQKGNGSFGGGTSTEGSNSNSTGLAGWALASTHSCGAAARAAQWVESLQLTGGAVTGEDGAIAYNRAEYAAALSAGIPVAADDQWRRATAQAAPALRYLQVADCKAL
jgi:hypothetical protein